jgi:hypothetical protein
MHIIKIWLSFLVTSNSIAETETETKEHDLEAKRMPVPRRNKCAPILNRNLIIMTENVRDLRLAYLVVLCR